MGISGMVRVLLFLGVAFYSDTARSIELDVVLRDDALIATISNPRDETVCVQEIEYGFNFHLQYMHEPRTEPPPNLVEWPRAIRLHKGDFYGVRWERADLEGLLPGVSEEGSEPRLEAFYRPLLRGSTADELSCIAVDEVISVRVTSMSGGGAKL